MGSSERHLGTTSVDGEAARRIFVSGPPGSGKSTIGKLLAAKFDRSAYIDADVIREAIVAGFEPPTFPISDGFVRQTEVQREIAISWAERMAAAGFLPVLDDAPMPSPEQFTGQYRAFWNDPRTAKVMLRPDADEVRRRIRERNGPFDEFLIDVVDVALSWIDELDLSGWHLVDSTRLSAQETADLVFDLVR